MQIPSLIKKGYRYKFSLGFRKDDSIKKVLVLMLPVMISTWVQPINLMINSRFASGLYNGAGVSVLDYANNLYTIIVGVFVLSVANVIFPRLSRMTANKDSVFQTVIMTLRILSFIIIPMTAGTMVLSNQIITLIYQRGDFTAESTLLTSGALMFFAIGMLGYGFQIIISLSLIHILTGVISSFIAQGIDPFFAAAAGAYIHGLSGDICKDKMGSYGVMSWDIAENIADAIKQFR